MPKTTTLYHPVPLEYVRGLFKYHGAAIGRIVLLPDVNDRGTYAYSVTIAQFPNPHVARQLSPDNVLDFVARVLPTKSMKAQKAIYNGLNWSIELHVLGESQPPMQGGEND